MKILSLFILKLKYLSIVSIIIIKILKICIIIKIKNSENYKINDFISNYLSTEINDMEYDFAIKEENRNCFVYFWERLKESHLIFDILLGKETIKPRIIKISLLLVDIDLYFLINGLFINEDYLSTVYHSTEKETFFSFIWRGKYNFFYAAMV